jgi:hypothetical protein
MHLISPLFGFSLPNAFWVSSDENLAPQRSHLITIGITKNRFWNDLFSFTAEVYAKQIQNAVSLKENTSPFLVIPAIFGRETVDKWSEATTQGKGESYGMEYMLRKEGNHFEGWISYTLSKTTLQFDAINNGKSFPATYDRRHDLGIYASYRWLKQWKFSANFVYGTGNAISLPVGEYYAYSSSIGNNLSSSYPLLDFEDKNNYRMKPYHRLDISLEFNHVIAKKMGSIIVFSIYNLYNRANPFFYQLDQVATPNGNGKRKITQVSLFPIMPSVSWTIKI